MNAIIRKKMSATTLFMFLLVAFLCHHGAAQNDPLISQQGLQRFIYNPAATGTSNFHQIGFISRSQWNGFPDAPKSNILTAHTFLPRYNVGVGLVVIEDRIGLEQNLNIKTAYSYHVWLNDRNILSFGVTAGIYSKKFDIGNLVLEEQGDLGVNNLENSLIPDFDFGIEYQRQNFTLGASSTHILNSYKGSDNVRHPRHFHAYAHYIQPVSGNFFVRGIASFYNTRNINGYEVTAIGEFENLLWAGASYRFSESVVFLAGVHITPNIRIGYSYDWTQNVLKRYTAGSHEVFLHFKLNRKNLKSKSPRFFN